MEGIMMKEEPTTRVEWIVANTQEPVVDIGCGRSIYYWEGGTHIEEDIEYLGIDRYKDPINEGPGVPDNFVVAAAEYLPLQDNKYKTALVGEVLEHCENPVLVIEEAYRVAFGQVLITVTHEEGWAADIDFDGPKLEHPKRKYDRGKLIKQCIEAGIHPKSIELGYTRDFPIAFHLARIEVNCYK